MGFKILIAVRQAKLALYIKPKSPSKDTLRTPGVTAEAPSSLNSLANSSSNPKRVLASIR